MAGVIVTVILGYHYGELRHALPDSNGADDWLLPVPATFVIGNNSRIALAHVDIDYRNRLEPTEAIMVLEHTTDQNVALIS